jgi:hypothetical protein
VTGPPEDSSPALGRAKDPASALPRCLHCADELVMDDLWGWVHDSGQYLCRDKRSGELLCQPATLI